MVLMDFLSVPKIIGIGPIIITPADLVWPFCFRRVAIKTVAKIKMRAPINTRIVPNRYNVVEASIWLSIT